jgi:hypothetical protein
LLVLALCLVKASAIYLIKTIFSVNFKVITIWYWAIVVATMAEALLGSLIISAGCSPSGLLEAPNNSACSNNVYPPPSFPYLFHPSFLRASRTLSLTTSS